MQGSRADGEPSAQGEVSMLLDEVWGQGARGRMPLPGDRLTIPSNGISPQSYSLKRIEGINFSQSPAGVDEPLEKGFNTLLQQSERQRLLETAPFNPTFEDPDLEKSAVLNKLRGRFVKNLDGLQKQNIMLALHGCGWDDGDQLCTFGFRPPPPPPPPPQSVSGGAQCMTPGCDLPLHHDGPHTHEMVCRERRATVCRQKLSIGDEVHALKLLTHGDKSGEQWVEATMSYSCR